VIGTAPEYQYAGFHPARRLEVLYIHEDMQIATILQFTAVYSFTRLISSLLASTEIIRGHADETMKQLASEYRRLLRLGGFLGIWLYIIAGIVRAVIVIGISLCTHWVLSSKHDIEDDQVKFLENCEEAFTAMIGVTFMVLTLVSVLNMHIMTRTFIVRDKLGDKSQGQYDANLKFVGARVLLICSEVVPKVIDAFEEGTPMFEQTKMVTQYINFLYMNCEQAEILKITIMNLACLVAVVMNFIFWKDLDLQHAGLLDFKTVEHNQNYDMQHDDDDDEKGFLSLGSSAS